MGQNQKMYVTQGSDAAHINSGGTINLNTGSAVDLKSGAVFTAESGAAVNLESGSVFTVESGAVFNVESGALVGKITGVTFVIGAEITNVINVAMQLIDPTGADLAVIGNVRVFLSDASTGIGLTAAVPDTSVVIGTDGAIIETTLTSGSWLLQSEADGDIDIDISEVGGAGTWYVVVVLPDGTQIVSTAVTFA